MVEVSEEKQELIMLTLAQQILVVVVGVIVAGMVALQVSILPTAGPA
jgi:hypothetical protein